MQIQRADDATLFNTLTKAKKAGDEVLKSFAENGQSLQGENHSISIDLSSDLPWSVTEEEISEAEPGRYLLSSAEISFRANFRSGSQTNTQHVTFVFKRDSAQGILDEFIISKSQNHQDILKKGGSDIVKAIYNKLNPLLVPASPEDGGLIPTLSNLALGFDTTYRRISSELSEAVESINNERVKQLNDVAAQKEKLEEEIEAERERLISEATKEIQDEKDKVAHEFAQLEIDRAELDLSRHKDARRKQFLETQKDLANAIDRPVSASGLQETRWAVFVALMIAGGASGFLAYQSLPVAEGFFASPELLRLNSSDGAATAVENSAEFQLPGSLWFLVLRIGVLSFVSIAAFFSAAAWLRYFYMRDLQAQEELRRFRNDMARASWAIDAAMEIRREYGEEIPPEWLEGVTEGLFSSHGKQRAVDEGAQALAALIGMSGSVNVGPEGISAELNKKGRRKVAEAGTDG